MQVPDDTTSQNPMSSLGDYDHDVRNRYPAPDSDAADGLRDYEGQVRDSVRRFYYQNHVRQTVDFVRSSREKYLPVRTRRMGIWQAMDYLNDWVDDSDPDTEFPQIVHAVQTAEAIRADGHPDWFVLTGLIHDMGKVLCLFDEPQWAVTGDTFPVGCRYSESIVYQEFFQQNPDWHNEEYQTVNGIYEFGCGLDNVLMSWGHDEYLYNVVKDFVPREAQYMIRYHSFYPAHREGAYAHLMNDEDRRMFDHVREFNPYDLYTKIDAVPELEKLMPYYHDLVSRFFPNEIWW